MKEEKTVTSKRKKKSKISLIILLIIATFMVVKGIMLQPQISKNQDKIAELEDQIDYQTKKAEEVDNLKLNVNSDEYIEKIARENLGMIRKDEIVFIDVTGQKE